MLVFQTAGVTLLATMIAAIAISSARGRFGAADEGSVEPVQLVVAAAEAGEAPEGTQPRGMHVPPQLTAGGH